MRPSRFRQARSAAVHQRTAALAVGEKGSFSHACRQLAAGSMQPLPVQKNAMRMETSKAHAPQPPWLNDQPACPPTPVARPPALRPVPGGWCCAAFAVACPTRSERPSTDAASCAPHACCCQETALAPMHPHTTQPAVSTASWLAKVETRDAKVMPKPHCYTLLQYLPPPYATVEFDQFACLSPRKSRSSAYTHQAGMAP